MEPTQDKSAGTVNPLTGRTRTGGTYDTATRSAIPQAPTTAIPVSAIETTAPAPLAMPEMQVPQADIGGARSAGQQIIDRETQRAQEAVARTEAPITESERQIREMFGILGTESQARNQMEEQRGVNRFSQDLNRFQESLRNQIAQLDQFDLDNVNTIEQMRVDASRRDITKRTFSAQSAEANIQMAVQRAGMVASTRATIAGIEATRGNLQAATEQVDKALKAIYEPVRMGMQMEMFFLERNDKRFDAAQKELANARMMGIQQQMAEIERATVNAETAVASGYASPDEIRQLIDSAQDPQTQNNLAQQIIGRAQRAEVQTRNAQIAASRSNAAWSQRAQAYQLAMNGDPAAIEFLGFDPRQSNMSLQDTFNYMNETMEDDAVLTSIGKALNVSNATLNASTGVVRSPFGTGLLTRGLPAAGAGALVGSKVPVVGTIAGGAAGLIGGTAVGFTQIANEKKDLMGALGHLANTAAFVKLREYREAGISFGQLTEAERIAIGRSASALFAVLDVKNDGTVGGINASPQEFQRLLQAYQKDIESKKEQKRVIYGGFNPADMQLIEGL
jgi:hypothetical protein